MTSIPGNMPFQISTSDPTAAIREADRIVVGQLGQTLDGCIATPTGESKYINSDCGLTHLHSARSAVDAIIVGVGSVNADNPSLTVRKCKGCNPARVIIDPSGRVDMTASLFHDNKAKVIVITSTDCDHPAKEKAEIIQLPAIGGVISPMEIISNLTQHGYARLLVEGGNRTISTFLDTGTLDRLHLIVAPVIMGGGMSGLQLSPIDQLHEALRPAVTLHPLGRDVLFDCNFRQTATPG